MDTLETIKNRRSIRKFKADPVDEKTVETLLDAARLAPSWANTQCWKFVVVREAQTKSALADCSSSARCSTLVSLRSPPGPDSHLAGRPSRCRV